MYESTFRFAATLRTRKYEGLDLVAEELPGAQHPSLAEYSRSLDVLYPMTLAADTNGIPNDRAAASRVVQVFLADYARRDASALARHMVRDSGFSALVGDRLIEGQREYVAAIARNFATYTSLALTVDTLRVMSEDPGTNSAIASVSLTSIGKSGRRVQARSRMMFELAPTRDGWRILFVMHDPPAATPVTTVVQVKDDVGKIAGASVQALSDVPLASARTDASGVARLPYDWHEPRRGHLRVEMPWHETAVLPLPSNDTVVVTLRRVPPQ